MRFNVLPLIGCGYHLTDPSEPYGIVFVKESVIQTLFGRDESPVHDYPMPTERCIIDDHTLNTYLQKALCLPFGWQIDKILVDAFESPGGKLWWAVLVESGNCTLQLQELSMWVPGSNHFRVIRPHYYAEVDITGAIERICRDYFEYGIGDIPNCNPVKEDA